MKTGVVLSIDHRHALIFTADCQLLRLPLTPEMAVGREIVYGQTENHPEMTRFNWQRLAYPALVSIAVLIIVSLVLWSTHLLANDPVYAYVSVDVKSSMQLSLDRQLNVIAIEVFDSDSANLIVNLPLVGLPWQQAITIWIEKLEQQSALVEDTVLISAVLPKGQTQFHAQLNSLRGHNGSGTFSGLDVHVALSNDEHVIDDAHANHLTIGRQILLVQSRNLCQDWNESTIATAPLSLLVHTLLANDVINITSQTGSITQSLLVEGDLMPDASEQLTDLTLNPSIESLETVEELQQESLTTKYATAYETAISQSETNTQSSQTVISSDAVAPSPSSAQETYGDGSQSSQSGSGVDPSSNPTSSANSATETQIDPGAGSGVGTGPGPGGSLFMPGKGFNRFIALMARHIHA
ncbi:MAG: anti-sigma factor domain-containing protein [Eubacteriales bacterium]|nr:anti-sigma factor domain-containing protein [Eubacteriales bacterium]